MNAILNNPYRTVGLLVGATAKEQSKQINKLKMYLEAEQDPQDDFSFPTLGNLHRTLDKVNESAPKLSFDSDKINAALFWFYNGNPITDEPAFDAIKQADLDQVINIWSKLTSNGEVSQRNASAYSNLGTFYLSGILEGTNTNEAHLEQGISLKLKFLESDFIKDFKALATDEKTFKITKKELQLLFLNQVQSEVEKNKSVTSNKFLDILTKQEFSAKEDFFKGYIQKPIELIEKKIEESKAKRKANKENGVKIGEALHKQTTESLNQLKTILGVSNIKYSSIADKVANEMLQCSIDFFNDSQEKDSSSDYAEVALKLANQADTLALGKITKDRLKENIETISKMRDREISQAIQALKSVKETYEANKAKINAQVKSMPFESIDWDKVEEAIKNSLNWDKVVELIEEVIPQNNIEKIKNSKDQLALIEYKSLVTFVTSKLTYLQKNKVRYVSYWETQSKVPMPTFDEIPTWLKWMVGIGILLIIVFIIWGEKGVENVFGIAFVVAIFLGIGWLKQK
jgi:hypothetical protein